MLQAALARRAWLRADPWRQVGLALRVVRPMGELSRLVELAWVVPRK